MTASTVTYLFPVPPHTPGSEREVRELATAPDPVAEARNAPEGCFGFYYGERGDVYYIDGKVFDRSNMDQFPHELDPHGFLRQDIAILGLKYVQQRNIGWLAGFGAKDKVVATV